MRNSGTTPQSCLAVAAATLLALCLSGTTSYAAEADGVAMETYEWSADLLSYDPATGTAVFQARVDSYRPIAKLDEFADGDRLILSWTGRFWASGVRGLARDPALEPGTLSLPVEFVAAESDGRYINFRIPVPENAVDTIAAMEPGMRVTATSPKAAVADWSQAVTSMRHYNDVD